MSVVLVVVMGTLLVFKVIDITTAMATIDIVVAFWFLSGVANRFNGPPQNPTASDHTSPTVAPGSEKTV